TRQTHLGPRSTRLRLRPIPRRPYRRPTPPHAKLTSRSSNGGAQIGVPPRSMSIVAKLNSLADDDARAAFSNCCAADKWVNGMLAARPFASDKALFAVCDAVAATLLESDWLEAFAAHPLIGDV